MNVADMDVETLVSGNSSFITGSTQLCEAEKGDDELKSCTTTGDGGTTNADKCLLELTSAYNSYNAINDNSLSFDTFVSLDDIRIIPNTDECLLELKSVRQSYEIADVMNCETQSNLGSKSFGDLHVVNDNNCVIMSDEGNIKNCDFESEQVMSDKSHSSADFKAFNDIHVTNDEICVSAVYENIPVNAEPDNEGNRFEVWVLKYLVTEGMIITKPDSNILNLYPNEDGCDTTMKDICNNITYSEELNTENEENNVI